jgi:hypothetical protein
MHGRLRPAHRHRRPAGRWIDRLVFIASSQQIPSQQLHFPCSSSSPHATCHPIHRAPRRPAHTHVDNTCAHNATTPGFPAKPWHFRMDKVLSTAAVYATTATCGAAAIYAALRHQYAAAPVAAAADDDGGAPPARRVSAVRVRSGALVDNVCFVFSDGSSSSSGGAGGDPHPDFVLEDGARPLPPAAAAAAATTRPMPAPGA